MFNLRNVLLTLHILFALLTIGWLAMHAMLLPRAIRGGNAAVLRFTESVASKLGPAAIVVFLLGIWLVVRQANDGADFDSTWVGLAMFLFVVALVNGAVFIAKTERAAIAKIEAGQPTTAEAKRAAMLGGINGLIVVVILWLMVAKPGA